jgi:hypothetical protein
MAERRKFDPKVLLWTIEPVTISAKGETAMRASLEQRMIDTKSPELPWENLKRHDGCLIVAWRVVRGCESVPPFLWQPLCSTQQQALNRAFDCLKQLNATKEEADA